ncbi:hypothetical protein BVX98_03370 [bacterium F11]|nr:hypothetical protein BVX98_03370 [bacterium F11]
MGNVIPLKTQQYLLHTNNAFLELIQARFSGKVRWNEDFLIRLKPKFLVETGPASNHRPSLPPWPDLTPAVPQKMGIYQWSRLGT